MSETVIVTSALEQTQSPSHTTTLAGVLVMSFSSLLLELALTRLFSVTLFYHFAFLAISIALLGLGAGGVFAYLRKNWLSRWETATLGYHLSLLNSVLLLVVLEIDLLIPVRLSLNARNFLKLTAVYLTSALPFFVIGLFFSILFARSHRRVTQLYAADLTGGALACLGVVYLLNLVGGPSTIIAAAAASALAAAIWSRECPTLTGFGRVGTGRFARLGLLIWPLLLAAVSIANHSGKLVDIVYAKGARRNEPWVAYARWNAFSRVEVDDLASDKVILIDADASTYIVNSDPNDMTPDARQKLMSAPSSLANILRPRGSYAIIGPGGGVDVLRAVANGSPSVTGIEINPIIVNDIMRDRYADFSHHLYTRPEVHINVADGRSWIRNSTDKFDVLQMTLVDTWASTAAGAFALSENNLYTTEAFREYFDHLKPDGFIAITRWEFAKPREALRVVSQAIAALERGGIQDFSGHFMIISDGALNEDGRPVTVLAKKTPFTPDEEFAVIEHVKENPNLFLLYVPSFDLPNLYSGGSMQLNCPNDDRYCATRLLLWFTRMGSPEASRAFYSLIAPAGRSQSLTSSEPTKEASTSRAAFIANYPYNISPVSDNAPFFFFTVRLKDMLTTRKGHGIDWKVNLGVVVLLMVFVISVVAVLAFLIIPLLLTTRNSEPGTRNFALGTSHLALLFYFIAIGLGYILAEIAFIQRFVLFLGHPTYALTVVIFLMLLASGAGSLLSRRWLPRTSNVWLPLTLTIILLSLYVFALPPLLRNLVGLPFALKLLVAAVVLIPLGLAMGMPFPTGLRALAEAHQQDNTIEWAWALNAASSVLGSVLAMLIAIQWGLAVTLACGAVAYFAALTLSRTLTQRGALNPLR
jgi:hypothetical protein